jgi:hypothetical protein
MSDWTSGHWTDEQLIADSYGVGPADGHLGACSECRARRAALIDARNTRERLAPVGDEVSFDYLAAQRRGIYARLAQPARMAFRRLAPTAAAMLVIGAGVFTYQEEHRPITSSPSVVQTHISDAQLVNEVAEMGQDSEPAPVAPIEELFD